MHQAVAQQGLVDDQKKQDSGGDIRPKKKKKSQLESQSGTGGWNEVVRILDPGKRCIQTYVLHNLLCLAMVPPSLRGELDTLNTLVKLNQLASKEDSSQNIFPLIKQCLTLIGSMLKSILKEPTTSSHTLLQEICSIVPLVITQSLNSVFRPGAQDIPIADFIQTLHEHILLSAISHFSSLSESRAASLLSRRTDQDSKSQRLPPSTDLRPVLLRLCQNSLNALRPNSLLGSSLSAILSHSMIMQLKKDLDTKSTLPGKKATSATERVRRIAFKDTFWYLVFVLHACFSFSANAHTDRTMSPLEAAARTSILISLAEILENKEENKLIGPVERDMLLGVVEQAWVNRWVPFPEQRDDEGKDVNGIDHADVSQENETS